MTRRDEKTKKSAGAPNVQQELEKRRRNYEAFQASILFSNLAIAITFCDVASSADTHQADRCLRKARETYGSALRFLAAFPGLDPENNLEKLSNLEEALRCALTRIEARSTPSAEVSRILFYDWDFVTDRVMTYGGLARLFGVKGGDQVRGQELSDWAHPTDRERVAAASWITPERRYFQMEYRAVCQKHTVVWVERAARAVLDENSNLIGEVGLITNIAERKWEQEARSRFVSIVESSTDAIIGMDPNGLITAWNGGAVRMLGYTEEKAIGQSVTVLAPPELHDEQMVILRRMRKGQSTEHYETRRLAKDGRAIDVSSIVTPLCDARGEVQGASMILRNITERKLAEQALLEKDERFRLAMSNVAAGLYTVDMNGKVTYVNPAAEKMLGWTGAELLGRKMHDIIHYKYPDGSRFPANDCPALEVPLKGKEIREREETFVRRDGSFLPVIVSASPLKKQGQIIGMVCGFLDDTHRREAELAMRESEERFRVVANAAPVMIWMSSTDKLCTYFNEPWLKFTGRSMEMELGNGWAEEVHPEDFKMRLATYVNSFDRREPFEMEYRLRRHDGEYRWVFDRGVPRFNVNGSFAGYIGSCYDVTERKSAEEALSTVSRRLIEAHEEERTRIARELHDDFNQRIALLKVKLDRMRKHNAGANVSVDQDLEELSAGISELGSDIQALSHRLHSSKLEYLGIEAAASSFCKELSQQHGVTITFHCRNLPARLPREISLCLFRVLQEALQNAIKHSRASEMEVVLAAKSDEIGLTVRDGGVGFEPEAALRGHGLGLTSMRERLKLVGGQLSVKSKPEQGTTIQATIFLQAKVKFAGTTG